MERRAPNPNVYTGTMRMDPLFDFSGKVVLVTGGTRGLGYRMARAFAERGASLVVASRRQEACDVVAGRPGNPEEIVTAALFLASPASTFVASALLRVDGGLQ